MNQTSYGYDAASRLNLVTSGTNTATYAYVPNQSLVASVTFAQSGTPRLVTTKTYDQLNRLASVASAPSASSAFNYAYTYNNANQRTRVTRENATRWDYGYDALGQVTSAVKKQSNGDPILGRSFAYLFDDIGNRQTATVGGVPSPRISAYTSNSLVSVRPGTS